MTADIRARLVALLGDPSLRLRAAARVGVVCGGSNARQFHSARRGGLGVGQWCLRATRGDGFAGHGACRAGAGQGRFRPPPRGAEVAAILADDPAITHVVAIHCETSSGILNPLPEIAQAVDGAGRRLLVDSMSAFGGVPFDTTEIPPAMRSCHRPTNASKGVPGFGFVLARREVLEAAKGNAHSLALDIHAQWAELETVGPMALHAADPHHRSLCRGAALARG